MASRSWSESRAAGIARMRPRPSRTCRRSSTRETCRPTMLGPSSWHPAHRRWYARRPRRAMAARSCCSGAWPPARGAPGGGSPTTAPELLPRKISSPDWLTTGLSARVTCASDAPASGRSRTRSGSTTASGSGRCGGSAGSWIGAPQAVMAASASSEVTRRVTLSCESRVA